MKKLLAVATMLTISVACAQKSENVEFKSVPAEKKVEVYVGGKLFTNYIYPDNMEKQVLNPIYTASGIEITRGYPLTPRAFERTDHPHHVGHWFNFGDVNGLDFWNNSFAIPAERKDRYGTVKFVGIEKMDNAKGELVVKSNWTNNQNEILLEEETTFIFGGDAQNRWFDRISKLTAKTDVTFTQNKEGMVAIRMDRAFEEPSTKHEKFLDANGIETDVPIMNSDGVNGVYHNAQGVQGGDVWAKRSEWVALNATKGGENITVAIIDNQGNPNYPAWSHARGYGLFATNSMGGQAFDKEAEPVKLDLKPGENVTFKYRIVIGVYSDD
ncbi:MAG: PmoA family protein, partial [Rikenellaceae bacterium]|nr:PmoA family protein [Rikenellaceae bacterium]